MIDENELIKRIAKIPNPYAADVFVSPKFKAVRHAFEMCKWDVVQEIYLMRDPNMRKVEAQRKAEKILLVEAKKCP